MFREAGRIVLAKFKADGTLDFDKENMVVGNGTVQSIAPNVNITTTELDDGNALFPMGVYDSRIAGQILVTMSSFQPTLYAALLGTEVEEETDAKLWSADEPHTIPEDEPYEVKLNHDTITSPAGAIVVVGADGTLFDEATEAVAAGEFAVDDTDPSKLEFHADDGGKAIFVTYEYEADVSKFGLRESGARPVLHAIVSGYAIDEDEINYYPVNLIVDKCKAAEDINMPIRQREPEAWTFTLNVLKPRAGRKPVDWKFAEAISE